MTAERIVDEDFETFARRVFTDTIEIQPWQLAGLWALIEHIDQHFRVLLHRAPSRREIEDLAMALWVGYSETVQRLTEDQRVELMRASITGDPLEIPDVTDADRARWRREVDDAPLEQMSNAGAGMTIEELIGDIDLALEEYREGLSSQSGGAGSAGDHS